MAQAYHNLSVSDFSANFDDIGTWTNPTTGSWSGVAIGGNATIPDATRITTSSTGNFTTSSSGGIQRGSNNIQFLSTGSTDNSSSVALNLNLNASGRGLGNLTFDAACVFNSTGNRAGTLRVYYSSDNSTWSELTGTNLPFTAYNNVVSSASISAALPAVLNDKATVILRFYYHNGGAPLTSPTGSRPKISVDNVLVTSVPLGGDTTAPTILTYSPENGALDVPLTTTQLVANFSESVVKGISGNITLKLAADDSTAMTIDVTDPAVAVSGSNATITLPSSLAASTAYYVNIDAGAFKDGANNNFAGISDNSTWAFTTATQDLTAPSWVTLEPTGANALPTSNLVITYDEAILAGNGTVTIRKSSDASVVETLTVPGAQVVVSGNTATLNPSTVLDYATGYYVEVSAGAFTDAALNGNLAISGDSAWTFTTRAAPAVVISQYYEGAGTDRYIELKNLTGSPLPLDGYRVVAWSDTAPSDNEGWKSGTNTSTRETVLSGLEIPANGTLLIAEDEAKAPVYAKSNNDLLDNGGCTAINGDDSVVLYQGIGFSQAEVVDAVSFTTVQGADTSFYRLNNGIGFDFNPGSSILDFSGTWGTKTLAEVASALPSDDWYLSATVPIGTLTLNISPSSVAESAGLAAATATVTRSGDTTNSLIVIIESNKPGVADSELFVEIGAGQTSVDFFIDAIDNPWLTGDNNVTFTVSADRFLPASDTLTVQDDPEDEPFPLVINEIRVDDDLGDGFEYFELYNRGSVPVSLDNLTYIVIGDGIGGNGVIENVTALSTGVTLNPGDFYLVARQASLPVDSDADGDQIADFTAIPDQQASGIAFENEDNLTHLLVYAFSGSNSQDLDTNDDGTLDATPWEYIADGIGLLSNADIPPTGTEWAYGSSLSLLNIGPGTGQAGVPATSHVYRTTDGGTWAVGPFGGVQNPDNSVLADVKDTPGISNVPTPPGNNFADWIDGFEVGLLTGFNDDFDNDGLDNALENILGSSPAVANEGLTAVSVSAGSLKFRHTLAAEADIADDLTYDYEWSVDLANWNASGAEAGGTTVTFGLPEVITAGLDGAPDLVEVTATVSGTAASKVFARLRVDQVGAPQ